MTEKTTTAGDPEVLAGWFRSHAATLSTVDPDASLDDLEPLREIAGDARVVAVGEGAHFVEEFGSLQARVLRFLVERCGFTVFALEFGLRDGVALDRWLHGQGTEDDLAVIAGTLATAVNGQLLRWVRRHLTDRTRHLDFQGVDLPTTLSLGRLLEPTRDYLRLVDPHIEPLLQTAQDIAARFDAASAALAAPRWAQLAPTEQDRLTSTLARLALRMRALRPLYVSRSDEGAFNLALRDVEAATHADYMLRAMTGIYTGTDLPGDTSVRESYMAESMAWLLDGLDPSARVVLISHTNHVQKTPIFYNSRLSALPLGSYLADMLGVGYRSIALTHTAADMPEMVYPDDTSEVGFTLTQAPLDTARTGSVERALADAGLSNATTLTDLRGAPPIASIRAQSTDLRTPVVDAFDAVLATPTATLDPTVSIPVST